MDFGVMQGFQLPQYGSRGLQESLPSTTNYTKKKAAGTLMQAGCLRVKRVRMSYSLSS